MKRNSIKSGSAIPLIRNSKGGIIIRHKEYIADIAASVDFRTQIAQAINPSNYNLFPWLSEIAQRFEEYEFRGLIFEFKTLSSSSTVLASNTTSLGSVMMGTEYDVHDRNFENKVQMLNHEFSSSCKPSYSMIHAVECARGRNVATHLFTRDYTALPSVNDISDPRFYDMGIFQIATQGMPTATAGGNIGEVWASYEIEFFKPQIPKGLDTVGQQRHYFDSGPTATTFDRDAPLAFVGEIGTFAPNTIPEGKLQVSWSGKEPIISVPVSAGIPQPGARIYFRNNTPDGVYLIQFSISGRKTVLGVSRGMFEPADTTPIFFQVPNGLGQNNVFVLSNSFTKVNGIASSTDSHGQSGPQDVPSTGYNSGTLSRIMVKLDRNTYQAKESFITVLMNIDSLDGGGTPPNTFATNRLILDLLVMPMDSSLANPHILNNNENNFRNTF